MSEALEITGNIKFVQDTEVFDSGFQKRLIIVECQDGSYTNDYAFELMKDKVNLADGLGAGQEVCVKYNLGRAREYNNKWYSNHATCWSVKATGQAQPAPANDAASDAPPPFDSDDDIAF